LVKWGNQLKDVVPKSVKGEKAKRMLKEWLKGQTEPINGELQTQEAITLQFGPTVVTLKT